VSAGGWDVFQNPTGSIGVSDGGILTQPGKFGNSDGDIRVRANCEVIEAAYWFSVEGTIHSF